MSARTHWNCTPNGEEPTWRKYDAIELGTCQQEFIGEDKFWERVDHLDHTKETIHTMYGHFKINCGSGVEALHDFFTAKDCEYRALTVSKKFNLIIHNHLVK